MAYLTEADINPDDGLIPFRGIATAWIEERDLRPKTVEVYRSGTLTGGECLNDHVKAVRPGWA